MLGIQVVVFLCYSIFVFTRFGTLPSYSHSFYLLRGWEQVFFLAFCWGLAIPFFIQGNLLAGFGFAVVGSVSRYDRPITEVVHYGGAGIGIIGALGIWTPLLVLALPLLMLKNRILWVQIYVFFLYLCLTLIT